MSKLVRTGLMAGAMAMILAVGTTAPAYARGGDGGEETGGGYEVEVSVVFSGDAAPDGGGGYTISMPATCWWEQMSYDGWPEKNVPAVDGTSAEAMLKWYDAYVASLGSSSTGAGWYYSLPPREWFQQQAALEDAGTDVTFYTPQCQGDDDWPLLVELGYTDVYDGGDFLGQIPIVLNAWEVNVSPPEPVVDPEDLAIEAREVMEIAAPEVDRNPKMADGSAATFVNLPTWFWVTDPQSVGGEDGELSVRAEVVGSPVWAEVTAKTGGLSIASPAGSRECDPTLAIQPWQAGLENASGCTVEFSRASVAYPGGYPVTASTFWNATWEGVNQGGAEVGGDLDPLEQSVTVNVPVAEVQSVVEGDG
ncbi:hypothetical protein [Jiangella asiatica]|uniref:Enoyl reductase n=1 Tax=Jiangella asiatica TaxID=2530372 RepID=A0A4V2Z4D8_9ACTN|nr:hypothetical protein [Jiangella asiatica]TDE15768.1 hypothetical protein E1269_00180 [Jiangella asiatica]